MSFAQELANATAASVCNWLNTGGSAVAATFIAAGTFFPPTSVASRGLALGLLALDYGCSYNPNNRAPGGGFVDGCTKAADGSFLQATTLWSNGNVDWAYPIGSTQMCEISGLTVDPNGDFSWYARVGVCPHTGGLTRFVTPGPRAGAVGIRTKVIGSCATGAPPVEAPAPLPPRPYTTGDGCNWTVDFESWLIDEVGRVRPVVKISPSATTLASGGIIGGCNFSPIVYIGGGGGGDQPPWYAPWAPFPPGPNGEPWWLQLLKAGADAVLEAAVGAALNDLLTPVLPSVVYRLQSVCEMDGEGEPIDKAVETVIPAGKGLEVIAKRIDALVEIAQGLKDFKQPVCDHGPFDPVKYTGELVTVRFESKEKSPFGTRPLRKNLRYRRQNDTDLVYHARAWWNYEWRSGPFQVISSGLPWGRPQVWASTEAEGKRVLRWAADLAGVNLSHPDHKWIVNLSHDSRIGVALDMKTKLLADGRPWVTERIGSDGPPMVPADYSLDP